MASILNDVKHMLGLLPEDTSFDIDVLIHTNTALSFLTQLGVGPANGVTIVDDSAQWEAFYNDHILHPVKSYVYLRVRNIFDPPKTGFATESLKEQLKEMEYRLNVAVDY